MIAAAVVVVALAVLAAVALSAARARRTRPARAPVPAQRPQWTDAAGSEFGTLSDAQRCDLVFAIGALDDATSLAALEGALADPCDAVALAAAHALAARGRADSVQHYFAGHPGERSSRIAATLALLARQS